jgi:hypothetical protein
MKSGFLAHLMLFALVAAVHGKNLRAEKGEGESRQLQQSLGNTRWGSDWYVYPLPMCAYNSMYAWDKTQGFTKYDLPTATWGKMNAYHDFTDVGGALSKALDADLKAGGKAMGEIQLWAQTIGFQQFAALVKRQQTDCWSYALQKNCAFTSQADRTAVNNAKISFIKRANGNVRVTYTMAVWVNSFTMVSKGLLRNAQAIQDFIVGPYGIYANNAKMSNAAAVAAAAVNPQYSKFVSAFMYGVNKPIVVLTGVLGKATAAALTK